MTATELKTSGYTSETAERYLLNAGALFKNVKYN